jgi:hypothetical protein
VIEDGTERVDIGSLIQLTFTPRLLWRHVRWGTYDLSSSCNPPQVLLPGRYSEPKIKDLDIHHAIRAIYKKEI